MASENNNRNLNVSFSLNAPEFSKGIVELKQELSNLNAKFIENKQKAADTAKELKDLHEQQKILTIEIEKSGEATEEQKKQMQELSEKISQTTAKLGQLKAEESDIKSGIKTTTKELEAQKAKLDDNAKSAGILQKALDKLGTAAKAFIGIYGAKKLWELLIGSNEEMEQYQTSFEVMLGDTEKAKALITDIQNFAAKTPLSKSDSVSIGSLLMNYGVEADEVIDKMTKLGDLAGGNAEKMNRIALAYGQMLAKGKVTGEEMMQMIEAGVPLQNALAESIGVTGEEFSKMVSAGKVGIDDLDKAIEGLTTGNGKFVGMMEKQSQTMQGMLSTLQDNVSEFFRQMGEGAFGEVKDVLAELMVQLNEWEQDGTLQEWAEKLGTKIETLIQILKGAIEILFEFSDEIIAAFAGRATYSAASGLIKWIKGIKQGFIDMANGAKTSAAAMNVVALGFAAAVAVVVELLQRIEDANRVTSEYNDTIDRINKTEQDALSSGYAEIAMLTDKVKRYDELRTAADLTKEQEAELRSIAEELQGTFGDNVKVVDTLTGSYNDLSEALETYVQRQMTAVRTEAARDKLKELYTVEADSKNRLHELMDGLSDEQKARVARAIENTPDWLMSATEVTAGKDWAVNELGYKSFFGLTAEELNELAQTKSALEDVRKQIESVSESYGDLLSEEFKQSEAEKELSDNGKNLADSYEKTKNAIDKNKEAADKLTSSIKNVNSAYLEQNENGKLSYDTIMSLVEAGYASCLQIDEETNSVRLNTEAYKKLAQAKIEARMTDLKMEIADIEAEYNIRISDYTHSGTGSLYGEQIAESINRQKEEATAAFTAEAKAELAALQDLYDNIDSYVTAEKKSSVTSNKKEGDESREAIDKLTESIKKVNSAYLEQNENGKLSYDTTMSLIDAGYAACLEKDEETGAIKLNTEAYKELAQAKINARMNDLKSGDITSEVTAELAALQDLYDNIDSYITADNSKSKSQNTPDYSKGYEAYKTEADKKLALINKELEAKKELRDKTIAYLDEEIKKRKELTEDNDMQKEIDRVIAQLKYAQLDDFSRAQLEKKLGDLQEQQEEIIWERDIQKRKEAANEAYDEAAASVKEIQEQINNSVDTVKQIIESLKDGVTNISNVINSNNTVNNSANISLANQYLTMAQITKAVRDALIGDVTILTR